MSSDTADDPADLGLEEDDDPRPEYSLPTSSSQAVDHTITADGEEIPITLRPPTIPEMDEYEDLPEDVSWSDLYNIADKHLIEPELPPEDDALPSTILAINRAIREVGTIGATQFDRDVADELADRGGEPGN